MRQIRCYSLLLAIMLPLGINSRLAGAPLGTSVTYQGRLTQNGTLVNDPCDFEFRLWDADALGNPIGSTVMISNVSAVDGLFSANPDFGAGSFNGEARWLEVSVRSPAGRVAFTTLSPRQQITATPYAIQTRGISVNGAGDVGVATNDPQAQAHIAEFDLAIDSSARFADDLLVESQDAVVGLYSLRAGSGGSAIALREVDATGALVDTGGIARESNDLSLGRLHFTYGSGANYLSNPIMMTITRDGNVGVGNAAPTAKLEV